MPRTLHAAVLIFTPLALAAQSIATSSPQPLSTRLVACTIDAHPDTGKKSINATETLIYKNFTGQPLTTSYFTRLPISSRSILSS